jgi:Zn-dependent membrane protease YugP
MVLDLRDGHVIGITGFADASLFSGFGLPVEFDSATALMTPDGNTGAERAL